MTKQEILASLRERAAKLGRRPTCADLHKIRITHYQITKHFGDMKNALEAVGMVPTGCKHKIETRELLEDWVRVAGDLGRVPTRREYATLGKYSTTPLSRLCTRWSHIPGYARAFARKTGLESKWKNVLKVIERHAESASGRLFTRTDGDNEGADQTAKRYLRQGVRVDRAVYGPPCSLAGLRYEPVNELGVVYVFGVLAPQLGLLVERMQQAFPDCEAVREVEPGKWQRLRIEFEYASRNFEDHKHSPAGCDMIVCWTHNWDECPKELEVIELRRIVKGM